MSSLVCAMALSACSATVGADMTSTAGSGAGGDASTEADERGGATAGCDCGDAHAAQLELDCARQHDLGSTFAADLASFRDSAVKPYCLQLGICANGFKTLKYEWATEQSRTQIYDKTGALVYSKLIGYFTPPEACGLQGSFEVLGSLTIGSADPASDCTYCLVSANDFLPDATGASTEQHYYAGSLTEACDPALLE